MQNNFITFIINKESKVCHHHLTQVNSLHPGAIHSNISHVAPFWAWIPGNFLMWLFFKTPLQGAQTTLHVVCKKDLVSGEYYDNSTISKSSDLSNDKKTAEDLWNWSEKELSAYLK